VTISAAIESEVAQLPDEEASEFLSAMGLEEPGLDRLDPRRLPSA
jgi:ribosome-binding ATPase YchF (GTP1/OBG family)